MFPSAIAASLLYYILLKENIRIGHVLQNDSIKNEIFRKESGIITTVQTNALYESFAAWTSSNIASIKAFADSVDDIQNSGSSNKYK